MSSFGLCTVGGARIMDRYIMQVLPWPRTVILGCVGGHLHAGIIVDGASGVRHHEWGGGPAAINPSMELTTKNEKRH